MAAHQAPLSLGFSRQEHWNGFSFSSPMHLSDKWSCSVMSEFQQPHGLQPSRLLSPWDFPGKSTEVGCHCLLWNKYLQINLFFWAIYYNTVYIYACCFGTECIDEETGERKCNSHIQFAIWMFLDKENPKMFEKGRYIEELWMQASLSLDLLSLWTHHSSFWSYFYSFSIKLIIVFTTQGFPEVSMKGCLLKCPINEEFHLITLLIN